MPTLEFKGKQFVYAHHLSVPFRQLEVDKDKSLSDKPGLDDNLIIHGDNLHALKALLPQYAGKVKCIYIDPPYNTGNEGWCYNDNVNAPLIKEWLKRSANPVDKEDLERHDKWCSMMWPRLSLLRELLAPDGVIFVSIDDNEHAHLKLIMDELFGEECFVASVVWRAADSSNNDAKQFSLDHNDTLVYSKEAGWVSNLLERTEDTNAHYKNPDNDPKGPWFAGNLSSPNPRENLRYTITSPQGFEITPPANGWRWKKGLLLEKIETGEIIFADDGKRIIRKTYLCDQKGLAPSTLWADIDETGHNRNAKYELKKLFPEKETAELFKTPKPTKFIKKILKVATDKEALILDSFTGSGTTAHTVLALNKEDGGNRKFILVECEDYADEITAERVRRVIKGVPEAKDEALREGLDGSFTYCTLGDEINIESLLKGDNLPDYESLAHYVFYTATGKTLDEIAKARSDYFIGETDLYRVYLIYRPDRDFLRSNNSALNAKMMERIAGSNTGGKQCLVFASAKFMGQRELTKKKIDFCQLPYAIHRVLGD